MQQVSSLIRTKYRRPFARAGLVLRPRLQTRITEGLRGLLTLVIAPAGFGKTTLVAASLAGGEMPVAWLSLDRDDNQPGRFLSYLIAAFQSVDPELGCEASQLLAGMNPTPADAVMTSLVNDLEASPKELALVLDDYQLITAPNVHAVVTFLLDHCPHSFHMLIATRSDPPLPTARLRARGQLVELRAADLRFTQPEAVQFLNELMGLRLDDGCVAVLEERTEGWVAGLQMASIALQSYLSAQEPKDVLAYIQGFSGTNRYILDYMLEEVLASQPPEIQHFLLFTSILKRLTAPLCDALLTCDDGPLPPERPFSGPSASVLEYLEKTNLFLTPLDDERIWYRYHHLFADLLRARLDQAYPGQASLLHARAAAWLEQAGSMVEAVDHALAAGTPDHAARLVEENTTRLLAQGELSALMGWIEMLPKEMRVARPWLCIHQAYTLMLAGRPIEVEPLLAHADAWLGESAERKTPAQDGPAGEPKKLSLGEAETRALKGAVAAVRGFNAVIMGQDDEALIQLQRARQWVPAENLFDLSLIAWAYGNTMLTQGRLDAAYQAFEEQFRLGRAMGNAWTELAGKTFGAEVLKAQGHLHEARSVLEESLATAIRQGARNRGYIARVENGLASVLYELNDLETAWQVLTDAIQLIRQWPNPNHMAFTYALRARVLFAQGDYPGAWSAIGKVDQIINQSQLTRRLRRIVEAEIVRIWLDLQTTAPGLISGDPLAEHSRALIASWSSELASIMAEENPRLDECTETSALTLARVWLAAGRTEETLQLLQRLTSSAKEAGHTSAAVGSLVLTAVARQAHATSKSKLPGQLEELQEALELAEPSGYSRIFLDEGLPMRSLLVQWLVHAGAGPLREYAIRLLVQFDAGPHGVAAAYEKGPGGNAEGMAQAHSGHAILIEPLSQRELEVLGLLAQGCTNQQIARQLVVAAGTIKAHAASIYRKLDVGNRTEAVARARQLGILP